MTMSTTRLGKKAKEVQHEVQSDRDMLIAAIRQRELSVKKSCNALIAALKRRDQLQLPMAYILEYIPGENVTQKCELLNISRQTWYSWLRGATRPTEAQAKRLEEITGFHISQIRCSATAQAESMLATLTRS